MGSLALLATSDRSSSNLRERPSTVDHAPEGSPFRLVVLPRSSASVATDRLPDRAMRIAGAVLAGIILSVTARYAQPVGPDRTTPAWTRVTQEIRAQGMGNCYLAAFTLATNARALGLENVSVVQGTQMGEGDLAGVRFGHSWVEANVVGQTGRVAIDYSSGNTFVLDRDAYRFERQAQDIHAYSVSETVELAANGTYGPWTADVLSAWHP